MVIKEEKEEIIISLEVKGIEMIKEKEKNMDLKKNLMIKEMTSIILIGIIMMIIGILNKRKMIMMVGVIVKKKMDGATVKKKMDGVIAKIIMIVIIGM